LTLDRRITPYNSVIMVRAKTQLNECGIDGVAVEDLRRPLLVFFHADAIELIESDASPWVRLAGQSDIDLVYCTTAWQRRRRSEPAGAARPSSLVQFWAHWLDCWRTGNTAVSDDQPLLIRLTRAQSELGWQESLEVILAAASLEMALHVRFEASAWHSLLDFPDQRRAWQQLLDFELADLEVLGLDPDPDEAALGVKYTEGDEAGSIPLPADRLDLS